MSYFTDLRCTGEFALTFCIDVCCLGEEGESEVRLLHFAAATKTACVLVTGLIVKVARNEVLKSHKFIRCEKLVWASDENWKPPFHLRLAEILNKSYPIESARESFEVENRNHVPCTRLSARLLTRLVFNENYKGRQILNAFNFTCLLVPRCLHLQLDLFGHFKRNRQHLTSNRRPPPPPFAPTSHPQPFSTLYVWYWKSTLQRCFLDPRNALPIHLHPRCNRSSDCARFVKCLHVLHRITCVSAGEVSYL